VINPDEWFNQVEIEECLKIIDEDEDKDVFPIIIDNVTKVKDDFYHTFLSVQEIAKLYSNNVITYNFNTQRNKKMRKTKDGLIEAVNYNRKSVTEITAGILDGTFIANHIKLNILQTGEEDFIYQNRKLTINKASEIDIIDGFNRSLSIIAAVEADSTIE
jgi:hypothetical protein